ncbi:MAG: hypothetical protein LBH25_01840 [Fibromonadaceae bacterium]|jgi:hypothetical protein|nr:hypothetical protein [Fibromonadaceae bacterium]
MNKSHGVSRASLHAALAAGIVLAITFTLSCSSGDDGDGDSGISGLSKFR